MTTATAQNIITDAIERAGTALGYHEHIAVGMTEGRRMPTTAAARTTLDLTSALDMPALSGEVIAVNAPAKTVRLGAHLIASSRVAQAGARVIVAKEKPQPAQGLVLYQDAGLFRIVEPAAFAAVADGAQAADGELAIFDAPIRWADAPSVAYRASITRRQQKDVGGADLAAQILHSIFAGLAVEADRVLLAAISAASPGTFTLGAAAARGLAFNELRGFVGTDGDGATVDAGNALRAGGIEAELTQATASSLVSAFNRAAVAIRPEVDVQFHRATTEGDLTVVVFASLLGLVPDATAFWKVPA